MSKKDICYTPATNSHELKYMPLTEFTIRFKLHLCFVCPGMTNIFFEQHIKSFDESQKHMSCNLWKPVLMTKLQKFG